MINNTPTISISKKKMLEAMNLTTEASIVSDSLNGYIIYYVFTL